MITQLPCTHMQIGLQVHATSAAASSRSETVSPIRSAASLGVATSDSDFARLLDFPMMSVPAPQHVTIKGELTNKENLDRYKQTSKEKFGRCMVSSGNYDLHSGRRSRWSTVPCLFEAKDSLKDFCQLSAVDCCVLSQ